MKKNKLFNLALALSLFIFSCETPQSTSPTNETNQNNSDKKPQESTGNNTDTAIKTDNGANSSEPKNSGTKTLFAIYMVGSDLEDDVQTPKGTADEVTENGIVTAGAGSDDLREITEALKSMTPEERANLDIVVGFGGSRKQGWKGIKYTDGNCIIKDAEDNYFGNSDCYAKKDDSADMGKGDTLGSFITYLKDTYPVSNYKRRIIDLWDHGGAHLGYGPDTNTEKVMSLQEINQGLSKDPVKYDMVGFDACLMGNMETAKFVQNRAKYLLASEELEPGHGWNYTEVFSYLAKNPNSSIVELGKFMVDSFTTSPAHSATDGKTLALTDLSKLINVYAAIDSLSTKLNSNIKNNYEKLLQAGQKAEIYGKNAKAGTGYNFDIRNFLVELKKLDSTIDTTQLDTAVNNYVLYAKNDGTRPNSNGAAIFDINNKKHIEHESYNITKAPTNAWFNFVNSFVKFGTEGDTGKPMVEAVSDDGNIETKAVDSDPCKDGSCFKITDDKGVESVDAIRVIMMSETKFRVVGSEEADQVGPNTYKAPTWDGSVLMLDDQIVPAEFFDITDKGDSLYMADGVLNDEDVAFTFQINDDKQIVKSWATPYDTESNGDIKLSKEQFRLKKGDSIQFYYNIVDIESDNDDEWEVGSKVTLGKANFTFAEPKGDLFTFLLATDLKGNSQNTDLVEDY